MPMSTDFLYKNMYNFPQATGTLFYKHFFSHLNYDFEHIYLLIKELSINAPQRVQKNIIEIIDQRSNP